MRKRGPKVRLSGEKRARFLEVLGQTGNRRRAALAIGMAPRGMDPRRDFDPVFDRDWAEAVEQADRRLAGASGPLDCVGGEEPMVIRRGPGGKLRLVRAGGKRWSRPVEDYAGCVLLLKTSEAMPSAEEVFRMLRNAGERGVLTRLRI